MNKKNTNKQLDELISRAVGRENLKFDFNKWKAQNQQEIQDFQVQTKQSWINNPAPTNIWRTIMTSRITKFAAAVVIIVIIAIYYIGGQINITTPAFADVIEQIHKARSVTYKQTFFPGESWEFTTTEMIIESGIMRSEHANGDIVISDLSIGKSLHLIPNSKRAILTQRVSKPREKKLFNYLHWISRVQEGCEFTGQKEVNGTMTNVFTAPSDEISVWVDPDTNLPVRVETTIQPNPIMVPERYLSLKDFAGEDSVEKSITKSNGRDGGEGIHNELKTVMSDFVWNAELEETLFNLEPPEGYTVEENQFDTAKTRLNSLVQALTFWAEMSDGMFPSRIGDLGDPNMINPMLIEKFDKDSDQAKKQLNIILKGLSFAQRKMKVDSSCRYAGDGVKLGDVEKAIFWYRSKNSETYRVIYGDLSVKKVIPENLPK